MDSFDPYDISGDTQARSNQAPTVFSSEPVGFYPTRALLEQGACKCHRVCSSCFLLGGIERSPTPRVVFQGTTMHVPRDPRHHIRAYHI
jgi:hypothetical protein